MSDTNEPPHPDGSADEPAPPPPSEATPPTPPPPPPPATGEGPYGAPAGNDPYGAPAGSDPYGTGPAGGAADGGYDGAYGAPPPTDSPYGGPAGRPGGYQATDAIAYGWKKFMQSPGTMLVPTLVAWIGIIVVGIIVYAILLALAPSNFYGRQLLDGLALGVYFVVIQLLTAGLYRGSLKVTDGQDFKTGDLFEGYDKGQVVIASLLIGIGTAIGTFLCYIPGLVVSYLTFFTLMFVVDQHLSATDAIKASYTLVTKNVATTLVFWLLAGLILVASACICGIGLLLGIPVVLLALAYSYRVLNQQPVTPA